MPNLHRFIWLGYALNFALGVAAPLARAVAGKNAELWPVALSILLTHVWAFLLHRKQETWHRALTMGVAGLVSGGAIGMLIAYTVQPKPGFLLTFATFTIFGLLLTRLLIKEIRTETAMQTEHKEWTERFESMSDHERVEELQRVSHEMEDLLAKLDRRSRFIWPALIGGTVLLFVGIWFRFFSRA